MDNSRSTRLKMDNSNILKWKVYAEKKGGAPYKDTGRGRGQGAAQQGGVDVLYSFFFSL